MATSSINSIMPAPALTQRRGAWLTLLQSASNQPVEYRLFPLTPQIFHLRFRNQYMLYRTLLRIHEHAHHIYFRNRVFTLDEYYQWAMETEGSFDYSKLGIGFCLRDTAFDPFMSDTFAPLTPEEFGLIKIIRRLPRPFFVIATFEGRHATLTTCLYELAQAMFALDTEYADSVRALFVNNMVLSAAVFDALRASGRVHPERVLEEAQANLLADATKLDSIGCHVAALKPLSIPLRSLFTFAWTKHREHHGILSTVTAEQPKV